MGSDTISSSWARLHRLQASLAAAVRTRAEERAVLADARALGATAVPACVRALRAPGIGKPWVTALLREIAEVAPDRVRAGLRELTDGAAGDDAKLVALSLLAELGDETTTARFADPVAVHRQSLARFESQLTTPADVASAAELLLSRLAPGALVEFVEAFADACPDGARRLGEELCARVELDVQARVEVERLVAPLRLATAPIVRPQGRPAMLTALRHDDGRAVIAVARRVGGERRWRSLCVLIAVDGGLTDVLYRDAGTLAALRDEVIAPIEADGYQRIPMTPAAARRLVAMAARRAVALGRRLPSGYYLGRDLLELADSHVPGERTGDEPALLGRALELLAAGDRARARPLLEHVVERRPDDAEAVSALGLCRLGLGAHDDAVATLARAATLEPGWPLHHWNLAAAAHRAGQLDVCAQALVEFLAHADEPAAASVDASHARRVALARRFLADHRRHPFTSGERPRALAVTLTSPSAAGDLLSWRAVSRLWLLLLIACGCAEPLADDRCLRNQAPYRPVVTTTFDRFYGVVPAQLAISVGPYQDPEGDPFASTQVEVWSVSPTTEALITRVWSATVDRMPTAPATVSLADGAFDLGLTTLSPHTRYAIIARYRDGLEGTDGCGDWGPWSDPVRFGTDDGSAALFADDRVDSVYLEIPPASYTAINAQAIPPACAAFERDYHTGALRIGGQRFDGVGIKIKGGCGSSRNLTRKAAFKVNLSWDDPALAGCPDKRRYAGQRSLTLNNGVQDPTASNERLGYAYYHALGIGSSRAASVKLYVNNAYWGLYTLVESVERRMLSRWYRSDRGMLYEGSYSCDLVDSSLPFAETDDKCLRREFHDGPCDQAEPGDDPLTFGLLRLFVARLAALVDGTFVRDIEKRFDLDEYLSLWAADSVLGSWDSYTFNYINNYRVYHDPSDDRWHVVQSGIDQILGQDGRDVDPFAPQGLLARKCLRDPACKDRFAARLAEAVTVFEDLKLGDRAATILAQIRADVVADPRREYTMAEFDAAHARRRTWLAGRAAQLRARLTAAGY